jgi:alginate O-acetyltransferase complex protein AlgI
LFLSICGNLGLLGFFKYCNFFIESAQVLLQPLGWNVSTLPLVLPIGISFYTFQTLSYSIDVYRGDLKAERNLLDFALFVCFFPQLVAGPIVRAGEFLPQLQSLPHWSGAVSYQALQQILRGFFKKLVIADQLGILVDGVYHAPGVFSSSTIALAMLAYAGQIYGDFSGYSDIAVGTARLLGYQLPENFRHPYWACSFQEFWRRWHITLSTWLRDYLYIPLGGSRGSSTQTYANLMITMTLGGLWHGAKWPFVLWGLWHGACLCLERWLAGGTRVSDWRFSAWRWGLTFAGVLFGWTMFRASSLTTWAELWRSLVILGDGIDWYPPKPLIALGMLIFEHLLWKSRYQPLLQLPMERWYSPVLTGLAIWTLLLFTPQGFRPFHYFQF